jgi:hypothetical protein
MELLLNWYYSGMLVLNRLFPYVANYIRPLLQEVILYSPSVLLEKSFKNHKIADIEFAIYRGAEPNFKKLYKQNNTWAVEYLLKYHKNLSLVPLIDKKIRRNILRERIMRQIVC